MEQKDLAAQSSIKTGLISAGVIAGCVAVGAGISLVISLIVSPSSKSSGGGENDYSAITEYESYDNNYENYSHSESVLPQDNTSNYAQDTEREDDLSRFLLAVTNYQKNNNGKTPWSTGKTYSKFVSKYIDAKCTADTPDKADDNCGDEFRDPDGSPYHFRYAGNLESSAKVTPAANHEILVYTGARCGNDKSGALVTVDNKSVVSMLYYLDSHDVACIDTH
jgi:hypothetical protein